MKQDWTKDDVKHTNVDDSISLSLVSQEGKNVSNQEFKFWTQFEGNAGEPQRMSFKFYFKNFKKTSVPG